MQRQRVVRATARAAPPISIVALVVSTVLGLIAISPAAAHTDLLQASPGPAQRAGGRIDFVDLVFTEPVSGAKVEVVLDGTVVPGTTVQTEGLIIRFEFDDDLSESGRYDVTYRMTSFDLDQTEESFFFTFEPNAPQALRLGNAEDFEQGRNWIQIAATVILIACLAGLAFLFLSRLEGKRRLDPEAEAAASGSDDEIGGG